MQGVGVARLAGYAVRMDALTIASAFSLLSFAFDGSLRVVQGFNRLRAHARLRHERELIANVLWPWAGAHGLNGALSKGHIRATE